MKILLSNQHTNTNKLHPQTRTKRTTKKKITKSTHKRNRKNDGGSNLDAGIVSLAHFEAFSEINEKRIRTLCIIFIQPYKNKAPESSKRHSEPFPRRTASYGGWIPTHTSIDPNLLNYR